MKSPIQSLTVIVIVTILSNVYFSCSSSKSEKETEAVIPISVFHNADIFVVSKTGLLFFNNYITTNYTKTKMSAL